ncbi:MAG: GNAT family N-acetyltransferase [Hyphomicrobiales bacterium]|nr:MAG: GNAT family N-acetyltransferase [Hyphomicrobiales bacterium]
MTALTIRPANADEFATAIEWAAGEGWNPGLDDLPAFHAADPAGFLMGFLDGEPVSSISVVRYGATFGFLGFYIVHPDHRGSGIGIATWNTGMTHLKGRTIGLDGVVAQQDNYRKSGFVLAGRNIRFAGIPTALPDKTVPVRLASAADAQALIAYDRRFFADDRTAFIRAWAAPPTPARRTTVLAERDGEISGYGVIRPCREGYKIGPLFADDAESAKSILAALVKTLPAGVTIVLDPPEANAAAVALAESLGLENVFETARMYRGPAPDLPMARTFGITTFELG